MNATEYTANATRCLQRSQEAKDFERASVNIAQAAVWASLAQGAELTRIADSLGRLTARFGTDSPDRPLQTVCTCGARGFPEAIHSDDCPCYISEDWAKEVWQRMFCALCGGGFSKAAWNARHSHKGNIFHMECCPDCAG